MSHPAITQASRRQWAKPMMTAVWRFFCEPFQTRSLPPVPWSTTDAVVVVVVSTVLFSALIFGGFFLGAKLVEAGLIETPGLLKELGLEISTAEALELGIIDGFGVMSIILFQNLSAAIMLGIFFQVFLQLGLLYTYARFKYGIGIAQLGFRSLPLKMLLIMVVILFSLSVIVQNGIIGLYHFFGIEDATGSGGAEQLIAQGTLPLPVLFVFAGLIAPILEEVIFRGFFLAGKLKRSPALSALVGSAIFFALAHLNPANLFPAFGGEGAGFALPTLEGLGSAMILMPIYFLLGLLLGFSFLRTGSLYPGIAFHMVNNTAALLLLLHHL